MKVGFVENQFQCARVQESWVALTDYIKFTTVNGRSPIVRDWSNCFALPSMEESGGPFVSYAPNSSRDKSLFMEPLLSGYHQAEEAIKNSWFVSSAEASHLQPGVQVAQCHGLGGSREHLYYDYDGTYYMPSGYSGFSARVAHKNRYRLTDSYLHQVCEQAQEKAYAIVRYITAILPYLCVQGDQVPHAALDSVMRSISDLASSTELSDRWSGKLLKEIDNSRQGNKTRSIKPDSASLKFGSRLVEEELFNFQVQESYRQQVYDLLQKQGRLLEKDNKIAQFQIAIKDQGVVLSLWQETKPKTKRSKEDLTEISITERDIKQALKDSLEPQDLVRKQLQDCMNQYA